MGSFLMRWAIIIREIDQGLGQPAGKINVGVERINLVLSDLDGDLDPALPTPFLDIEYTGGGEGLPSTGCGPTNRVTRNWKVLVHARLP